MINQLDILGTTYSVEEHKVEDDPKLRTLLGYMDSTSHKIVIADVSEAGDLSVEDIDVIKRKILRHECVHAFLVESGLDTCSWADNEEMVDWLALQFPKIYKTFSNAEILE